MKECRRVSMVWLLGAALAAQAGAQGTRAALLSDVNDFLYQLQHLDLRAIEQTDFDLVVIDYSRDGSQEGEWSAAEIRRLREAGQGRIVLAYLSIGEAENYRFYWQNGWRPGDPRWLGPPNPGWPGNFKVRYWDPGWQSLLMSYVDRVLAQGFDGVYLDLVDAYWFWAHEAPRGERLPEREAADRMVELVDRIALHCRRTRPAFLICPQNATSIIRAASRDSADRYWRIIDAIGAEDTFFYGRKANDNPLRPQDEVIAELDEFVARGKRVLVIDYLTQRDAIDRFYELARKRGYIPYATVRDLGVLTINPGHEPD